MEEKNQVKSIDIKSILSKENLPLFCLIILGIYAIVAIVISCLVLDISPIIACVMVILEAGLGACLNRIPIWVHGLVFIAQIVCGIISSQVPFMILMVIIYILSIAFLYIWASKR